MDSVQLIPHWQDDVKNRKSGDNNPAKTTAPHVSAVPTTPESRRQTRDSSQERGTADENEGGMGKDSEDEGDGEA